MSPFDLRLQRCGMCRVVALCHSANRRRLAAQPLNSPCFVGYRPAALATRKHPKNSLRKGATMASKLALKSTSR